MQWQNIRNKCKDQTFESKHRISTPARVGPDQVTHW